MNEQTHGVAIEGPIEVRNEKDEVILSIGEYVAMADGVPRACNIAGVPYETVAFGYKAVRIEEIADIGIEIVKQAFKFWAETLIHDDDFYSIEWRIRPRMEQSEWRQDAVVIDPVTYEQREGVEIMQTVVIRARLLAHKNSVRPNNGLLVTREDGGIRWLSDKAAVLKAVA